MKKILIYVVGWTFILIGIVGLVLPILQGVLFICVGLLILSKELPWANRLLLRLRKKYPKIGGVLEDARRYTEREIVKIRTQKGYFWKRLPVFLLTLIILAALSWALSLLFGWLKDGIRQWFE
jgi:uncharacterized membrane protein YbaN (DUF454 family)